MQETVIGRKEYISQTEHALRGMFELLRYYDDLLREAAHASPVFALRHSGGEAELQDALCKWQNQPTTQQAMNAAAKLWEKHSAIMFSRHVISGSILQIAFKAIELFSTNPQVDSEFNFLFENQNFSNPAKYSKFLIGRKVKRVPIGLLIYAGRNQYNHFDERYLKDPMNRKVFDVLAWEDGSDFVDGEPFKNPSFDLDFDSIEVRSSIMLSALGWRTYSDYKSDIESIFTQMTCD